ncbi:MAG: hypothetical protein ACJA1Y_000974 [Burkholderiaceae bacterium]|jgi:hypothetical protein
MPGHTAERCLNFLQCHNKVFNTLEKRIGSQPQLAAFSPESPPLLSMASAEQARAES